MVFGVLVWIRLTRPTRVEVLDARVEKINENIEDGDDSPIDLAEIARSQVALIRRKRDGQGR